jgi:hypothetical protein
MIDHLKTDPAEQDHVFSRRKARMVQRITPIAADGLAMFRPGVEHQQRAIGCMLREHRKHAALIAGVQVKETVPGKNAVEATAEPQLPHVGHHPFVVGQSLLAKRYHGRG